MASEAWALHLSAEIAARRGSPAIGEAAVAYRNALAIAEALGMRALEARCHLGLGVLAGSAGEVLEARRHLAQARELCVALGIDRWHREAEAKLTAIAR